MMSPRGSFSSPGSATRGSTLRSASPTMQRSKTRARIESGDPPLIVLSDGVTEARVLDTWILTADETKSMRLIQQISDR